MHITKKYIYKIDQLLKVVLFQLKLQKPLIKVYYQEKKNSGKYFLLKNQNKVLIAKKFK